MSRPWWPDSGLTTTGRPRKANPCRDRAAAEHLESAGADENAGVLVDAQADVRGLPQDGGEQARETLPLGEVHVDDDLGQKAEARSGAQPADDRTVAVRAATAAQDHDLSHDGRTRARARDHQRAGRQAVPEKPAGPRSGQYLEAGLVPATEEDPCGAGQLGDGAVVLGLLPAGYPQLAYGRDAEAAECGRISREGARGRPGRRGDEGDPGAGAAREFGKDAQQTGTGRRPILGAPDDQEAPGGASNGHSPPRVALTAEGLEELVGQES